MPSKSSTPLDSLSAAERYQELSTRQVAKYVGLESTSTVWSYVKEGKLPKPRYIKPHQPLWRLGEVLEHTHGLMTTYDEAPRGFIGDQELQETKSSKSPGSAADKVRERLFGKK